MATALFTLDVLPSLKAPLIDGIANSRVSRAVSGLRRLAQMQAAHLNASAIVMAVDGEQAWRVAEILMPDRISDLRDKITAELELFDAGESLQDLTTHGNRSKIELIDWNGKPAIRKIYRRSGMRFMQREIEVIETFSSSCPRFVKLYEKGTNYIVVEFVASGWTGHGSDRLPKPLPLRVVRDLADFVKLCIRNGFDPVDHSPRNNIIFQGNDFRVIDCEFWRRCDPATPPEQSVSMSGLSADDLDGPRAEWVRQPYLSHWLGYTCLPLNSFLYDPPMLQRLKRMPVLCRLSFRTMKGIIGRRLRRIFQSRALTSQGGTAADDRALNRLHPGGDRLFDHPDARIPARREV